MRAFAAKCRVCSTIPRLRGRKWASMRWLERAKRRAPTLFALWELAAQPQGWIIGAGSGESLTSGSVRAEGCDSPPLLDCTANVELERQPGSGCATVPRSQFSHSGTGSLAGPNSSLVQ
jgi:hypothetical protein